MSKQDLLKKIKNVRELSGDFGEDIGKAWLEGDGWDYFDLNEKGLIERDHWIYKKDAKKADQISAHDEHKESFVIWDQKFHRLYDDFYFRLTIKELNKYKKFIKICQRMSKEDDFYLFFMFLPKKHDGKKICLVDINQFSLEGEDCFIDNEPALQVIPKEKDCHNADKYQKDILDIWMNKDI